MHPAFSHILGQDQAIGFLGRALEADRLPHGMIFAGPAGVGRKTTALALARIFLADRPNDPESLEQAGRLINAGSHPDFHFVVKEMVRELEDKSSKSKAVEFGIDVVREFVLAPAARRSVLGRGKVFILDKAETMNMPAQNALLKTLEEPAGRTLIILMTETPGILLSTIRSRSQLVRFALPSMEQALAILKRHGLTDADARAAATLADGSPGQALRWHQDEVVARSGEWFQILDQSGDLPAWLKAASEAYKDKQLDRDPLASEDAGRRDGITTYLRLAADHLRKQLPDGDDAQRERLIERIGAARNAEDHLDANVNIGLILQHLGATLTAGR